MNKLNGTLLATAAATIFATLPATAMAAPTPTAAPTATKAMNNCCGGSHNESASAQAKKCSATQKCSDAAKTTP